MSNKPTRSRVNAETDWATDRATDRAGDPIHPEHYKTVLVLEDGDTIQVEVIDIIEAFHLQHNTYMATAVAYLLRAGRKPNEPMTQDVKKAIWWLQRLLKQAGKD